MKHQHMPKFISPRIHVTMMDDDGAVCVRVAGTMTTSDDAAIAGLLDRVARSTSRHGVLVDARGLDAISLEQVASLIGAIATREGALRLVVRAVAVLLPSDTTRWALGQVEHEGIALPLRFFADEAEAHAWLGADVPGLAAPSTPPPALDGELPSEAAEADAQAWPIAPLRKYLAQKLPDASLDDAARALSSSRRTVQRYLTLRQTTFRELLVEARLERAQELLALSDMSVSAVSAAVGLRKTDHMRKLFREGLAMTPAEWRLASRPMRVQLARTSVAPEAAAPSNAGGGAASLAAPKPAERPAAFPPSTWYHAMVASS
ncbi:MAG: helix-turn-helix transcriptional regulator [Polyangiaceae bacterium]|nr:helix-turn-helix transcriptional regulator [Polyangiaceae bacterium]